MVEPLPSMLEVLGSIPYTAIGKKIAKSLILPRYGDIPQSFGRLEQEDNITMHVHTREYMGREREIKIEKEGKTIVYHKASGIDKA